MTPLVLISLVLTPCALSSRVRGPGYPGDLVDSERNQWLAMTNWMEIFLVGHIIGARKLAGAHIESARGKPLHPAVVMQPRSFLEGGDWLIYLNRAAEKLIIERPRPMSDDQAAGGRSPLAAGVPDSPRGPHKNVPPTQLSLTTVEPASATQSAARRYSTIRKKKSNLQSDMANTIERVVSDTKVDELNKETARRVLVIYTGGTIGMEYDEDKGWIPKPNALGHFIFCCPSLHDKVYAVKIFGKEAEHYPSGTLFVLPQGKPDPKMKRVFYELKEYPQLIDSSNMTSKEWIQIANDIKDNYDIYDGFVILHGTDTMAYTASALSFMLENLKKPVVITGAQLSIYEPRSDAKNNFLESLMMAGNFPIPEVTICFARKLFRGNRTSKLDSEGFDAFDSPNYPHLASLGVDVKSFEENIFWPHGMEEFRVHTKMIDNVAILHLFPAINVKMVRAMLRPPLEGIVLLTYGSGNVPSNRQELLDELKMAIERDVLVVNCTQCNRGTVSDIYETGKALSSIGAIPGEDMTPEAALTKLSYVLGRRDWDIKIKKKMMLENIRGELTPSDPKLSWTSSKRMKIWKALINPTTLTNVILPALISSSVSFSDQNRIDEIIDHGGDISKPNIEGRTPLHVAVSNGNTFLTKYLLDKGAKVDATDSRKNTPLNEAVQHDHHEIIKLLINNGATLKMSGKCLGEKLCRAAARGDIRKLQSFKLAGAQLWQEDTTGRTALHLAALKGDVDCTKFLIDEGCPKDKTDAFGKTPRDYAQRCESPAVLNQF